MSAAIPTLDAPWCVRSFAKPTASFNGRGRCESCGRWVLTCSTSGHLRRHRTESFVGIAEKAKRSHSSTRA